MKVGWKLKKVLVKVAMLVMALAVAPVLVQGGSASGGGSRAYNVGGAAHLRCAGACGGDGGP